MLMSLESEYDNLMTNGHENGITIFDYLDHKKQLQGTKHDPRFTHDMVGKIIY